MKKNLITPDMLPKINNGQKDDLKIPLSTAEQKQFEKSEACKKYVRPILERDKVAKKMWRKNWWWNRGLPLFSTLFSFIAAMAAIFAILLQLNLI